MPVKVINLNKDTANDVTSVLKGDSPCMLKITADWCGHCKTLKPEWDDMKKQLEQSQGTIIDIEDKLGEQKLDLLDKALTKKVGFEGYPHIIAMQGGSIKDEFKEERNSENLKNFFTRNVIDMQNGGWKVRRTISNRRRRRRTPNSRRRRTPNSRRRRTPNSRRRKSPFSRRRPRVRHRRGRGNYTKKHKKTRIRLGGHNLKNMRQHNKVNDLRRGVKMFSIV
tara:strand:+ start:18071 stop:18739 length:669 start_codon:yes stop_codon:yes gene_type:complete